MLYADKICEFLLQGLALGGEDAVEDVGVEDGQDGVAVRLGEGRPRLDEAVRNSLFAAENCESIHGSFLFYWIDDEWKNVVLGDWQRLVSERILPVFNDLASLDFR